MKQRERFRERDSEIVTPFVGVWIETRKLKIERAMVPVTPFVGVWIETRQSTGQKNARRVTPFVGVWIETFLQIKTLLPIPGHTLRGCVD